MSSIISKTRRTALWSIVSTSIGTCFHASAHAEEPPNVVLIYVDDLGYKDLESYGSEFFETPNIDTIMNTGIRFTQAYSNAALCAPSRIGLFTGRHCARTGCYEVVDGRWNEYYFRVHLTGADPATLVENWEDEIDFTIPRNNLNLPEDRKILPEYLKEVGYRTGFFGKWHMGDKPPTSRGFDDFVYLKYYYRMGAHLDARKGLDGKTEGYPMPEGNVSDYMAEVSLHFIDRAEDKPFFLYMSHPLIHAPIDAEPALIEKYKAKKPTLLHSHPVYAAMIEMLDDSVGQVLEGMRERGLMENTLIIFTSDNGGMTGYTKASPELGGYRLGSLSTHYPLRGGKVDFFEGGIRVPFGIAFGEKVSSGTFDGVVSQLDLLPTILDFAGHSDLPRVQDEFDGRSLKPILMDSKSSWEERTLYWHYPDYRGMTSKPGPDGTRKGVRRPTAALRKGNWKYHESLETGKGELYDLRTDEGETTDIAAQHPDLVAKLSAQLKQWQRETNAPMLMPKKPKAARVP